MRRLAQLVVVLFIGLLDYLAASEIKRNGLDAGGSWRSR
jgi:hypothetical protein